jgi:hypothetical protein
METVVIGILSILVLALAGFGFLAFKKLSEKQVVNSQAHQKSQRYS